MTFSDWYASNVAPQVEEQLKSVRADARPMIRKASRDAMAACWNAALDAANAEINSDRFATFRADPMEPLKVKP